MSMTHRSANNERKGIETNDVTTSFVSSPYLRHDSVERAEGRTVNGFSLQAPIAWCSPNSSLMTTSNRGNIGYRELVLQKT